MGRQTGGAIKDLSSSTVYIENPIRARYSPSLRAGGAPASVGAREHVLGSRRRWSLWFDVRRQVRSIEPSPQKVLQTPRPARKLIRARFGHDSGDE